MNDDLTQVDENIDEVPMDSLEEKGTKYAAGIYDDNKNVDYIDGINDLNNEDSDLDEGLGDDASADYDEDDSTLTAENDRDVTETGMDDVDADNLKGKENLGDIVLSSQE